MLYHPYFFPTDIIYFSLLFFAIGYGYHIKGTRISHQLRQVIYQKKGLIALMILLFYFLIASMDSLHFYVEKNGSVFSRGSVVSLFDIEFHDLALIREKTYSKPLALKQFTADFTVSEEGHVTAYYPRLNIFSAKKIHTLTAYYNDILMRFFSSFLIASICVFFVAGFMRIFYQKKSLFPRKTFCVTLGVFIFLISVIILFQGSYHLLGTDKIGNDILYVALKSIRTSVILGTLTTLVMLPFAIFLGLASGFFRGVIDDAIQFIYTTLSSVPSILLIIASFLSLQLVFEKHADYFSNIALRADCRLLLLCSILGLTSWTGLCRVLRSETFKIRELEYIQAARVLGTPSLKILTKHIFPNVLPIIFITVILDFSLIVLAEAVLTYVGVGVDSTTYSFGNMIDAARTELARTPAIWWPLLSGFSLMFIFILSLNIFADVVRDAIDPR